MLTLGKRGRVFNPHRQYRQKSPVDQGISAFVLTLNSGGNEARTRQNYFP
jgi:hypothetical protein